jgi:hypothetical protein
VEATDLETVRTLYRRARDGLGRAVERFVARLRDRGLYDPESDVLGARGGPTGEASDPRQYDDAQLRALSYLE